jgi:hypothetical protein
MRDASRADARGALEPMFVNKLTSSISKVKKNNDNKFIEHNRCKHGSIKNNMKNGHIYLLLQDHSSANHVLY